MKKKSVSIFWFRRDIRLEDNYGLFAALEGEHPVLPVFIFDRNILDPLSDRRDKRVTFIYHALIALNKKLQTAGSGIHIFNDQPLAVFKEICADYSVQAVYTNHDYEPYATTRDETIGQYLKAQHIAFNTFKDQVIFERSEVMKPDGTPYHVYTPYMKAWHQALDRKKLKTFASETVSGNFLQVTPLPFPSMHELGFEEADISFCEPGIDNDIITHYKKQRDFPAQDATTKLSVHLRFGTISIRSLVMTAQKYSETWLNELVWREFFMMILYHYPRVVTESFKRQYDKITWRNNEKEFERWCRGETGYPIVDAGMRELNETGFMHNRVRMVVASFLTKDLLIDWRWGEAYFAEKLLDYELSSNNGNWQWVAGTGCDAAPYFRVFNPVLQTKRFDPQLAYIKKWLNNFDGYRYEPIVDHEFARKRAIEAYGRVQGVR